MYSVARSGRKVQRFFRSARRRRFLREQLPLRLGKAEVVVRMVAGDAAAGELLQFSVRISGMQNDRRKELLEHVTVLSEHEREEFFRIVRDEVELEAVMYAGG